MGVVGSAGLGLGGLLGFFWEEREKERLEIERERGEECVFGAMREERGKGTQAEKKRRHLSVTFDTASALPSSIHPTPSSPMRT